MFQLILPFQLELPFEDSAVAGDVATRGARTRRSKVRRARKGAEFAQDAPLLACQASERE